MIKINTKLKKGSFSKFWFSSKRRLYKNNIDDYSFSLWPFISDKSLGGWIKDLKTKENDQFENMDFFTDFSKNGSNYDPQYKINKQKNEDTLKYLHQKSSYIEFIDMKSVDREVLLLGTSHSLDYSRFQVLRHLKQNDPASIVIEQCYSRIEGIFKRYEEMSESEIQDIVRKQKFGDQTGLEFILPFIYRDYLKEHHNLDEEREETNPESINFSERIQIIPGDLDVSKIDSLNKDLKKVCGWKSSKSEYLALKKLEAGKFMSGLFGKEDPEEFLSKTREILRSKKCIMNQVMILRELRLAETIINNTSGTSVFAIIGLGHLDRLSKMLRIYEDELNLEERKEFKSHIYERMKPEMACPCLKK